MTRMQPLFEQMCDELVLNKDRLGLSEEMIWINEEAFKRGLTTDEFIFELLLKQEAKEKAESWNTSRKESKVRSKK